MAVEAEQKIWVLLRLGLGWIFFWAFIDKLLGLGFATKSSGAWINGGSPTLGFLSFGTAGPLAGLYKGIAGNLLVDWLFMLGLLFVGAALLLGILNRMSGYLGALLMLLIWTSALLPENNPMLDDHIIYAIALVGISIVRPGKWYGLGERWARTAIVRKCPVLE
ncbi:MAG: hypothetical protein HY367_04290 [Candidatus Aenigmarchaeota archaeon]|nr:hypothetical protein [Candidatus Aenigmarchaeota archaeon]